MLIKRIVQYWVLIGAATPVWAQEVAVEPAPTYEVFRYVGETLAADLTIGDGLVLVDWRPREIGRAADAAEFQLFVDVDGLTLEPVASAVYGPTTAGHLRSVLIDTGIGVTDVEFSAFSRHAERLVAFSGDNLATAIASFDQTLTPIATSSTDPVSLMETFWANVGPGDSLSDPASAYVTAALELADVQADRRSIFLLTDGYCEVPQDLEFADLADAHQDLGVPVYVGLFAEDAPDVACLDLLTQMTEATGGSIYVFDQTGDGGIQPVFSHGVSSMGGRFAYSLDELVAGPDAEPLLTIQTAYLGDGFEYVAVVDLQLAPSSQVLLQRIAPVAMPVGVGALALMVAGLFGLLLLSRRSGDDSDRIVAWLGDIGATTPPIPLRAGRTVIDLPDASLTLHVDARSGVPSLASGDGILVNGRVPERSELRDEDLIETPAGRRFRFTHFSAVLS